MTPSVKCLASWTGNWGSLLWPAALQKRLSAWLTILICVLTIFPVLRSIWTWPAGPPWWKEDGTKWGIIGQEFWSRGIRCVSTSGKLRPFQELASAGLKADVNYSRNAAPENTLQVAASHSVPDAVQEPVAMNIERKSHSTLAPLVTIILCVAVLCLFGSLAIYVLRAVKQRHLDGRSIVSHTTSAPNYGTIYCVCFDTRFFFDWRNRIWGFWLAEPNSYFSKHMTHP